MTISRYNDLTGPSEDSPQGLEEPLIRPVGRLRSGWYVAKGPGVYTLSRRWPPRFDVVAETQFSPLDPARLARQIRQDLWRRLQGLRGFSPVVKISAVGSVLRVRAGGCIEPGSAVPSGTANHIAALLADPAHRARWQAWARIKAPV